MIVGGTAVTGSSKKAWKTYLKMVQNVQLTGSMPKIARRESPIIGFSKEDTKRLHHPHDDALVVSIRIELIPTNTPLVSFGGTRVLPLGAITLSVMVGNSHNRSPRT